MKWWRNSTTDIQIFFKALKKGAKQIYSFFSSQSKISTNTKLQNWAVVNFLVGNRPLSKSQSFEVCPPPFPWLSGPVRSSWWALTEGRSSCVSRGQTATTQPTAWVDPSFPTPTHLPLVYFTFSVHLASR